MAPIVSRAEEILDRVRQVIRTINGAGNYHSDLSNRVFALDRATEIATSASEPIVIVERSSMRPAPITDEVYDLEVAVEVAIHPDYAAARSWSPEQAVFRLHSDVLRALNADRGLEIGDGNSPLWAGPNSTYQGTSFTDPESGDVVDGFQVKWLYRFAERVQ